MLSFTLFLSVLSTVRAVTQLPARSETPLSIPQFTKKFDPYAQFAKAAYCSTRSLSDWTCGQACSALPGFQPSLAGGDGNFVQIYFVGYWPERNSVVVAHEGTDPLQLLSILTDLFIPLVGLDPILFPGVPSSVLVHEGFRDAHARTALPILAEVQNLLAEHDTNNLTLIGHSLGGAIAELDSLFFALNIPHVSIKTVTFGVPRVGNSAFAQLIDANIPDFSRVNNKRDPTPIVPGLFFGFSHPHGEIHIVSPQKVVACSGDDDATDPDCTMSTVPTILSGNIFDHLGPYDGIFMGSIFCI
ncbi:Alpha/Beta hydrolase protein [Amanita rubescens]|nr:Alpha/Beta hydrolase protein [Amanita rubescens]